MTEQFFAYGSFSVGQVHFRNFSELITKDQGALVKGAVYQMRCGYPILQPAEGEGAVPGTLYELEAPESFWPIFDTLLGIDAGKPDKAIFQRIKVMAQVGHFAQVEAWSYCLNPKKLPQMKRKILMGDWKKELMIKPPVTSHLQPRHIEYIKTLAGTRGRDIVPIKMDLYRELLNYELIVDKGRRLALTPLGKEAALFL